MNPFKKFSELEIIVQALLESTKKTKDWALSWIPMEQYRAIPIQIEPTLGTSQVLFEFITFSLL